MQEYGCDQNFIDMGYINSSIEHAKQVPDNEIGEILDKAEKMIGLSHKEVAELLLTSNPTHIERIYSIADSIKKKIYGDRVVLFAPLYISDYCVNKCSYCGFRCDHNFERKKLTLSQIEDEVCVLEDMGHKRLAIEAGEDPVNCDIDYIVDAIKAVYSIKNGNGSIRRANVNIAATTIEDYKKIHKVGIGTYILFQETYHQPTYEKVHLSGPKKDYFYHLTAFDRAQQAGINDVGAGVLFGLYDPIFEVIALMIHNEHLEKHYGVGFHTISVPRIRDAEGADIDVAQYILTDEELLKIVAILRIAVPFTGLIISTRESVEVRKRLISIGVSQISGGSSVEVGGYSKHEHQSAQFNVADSRPMADIIEWLLDEGVIPSFCTACYRKGRTGDNFMSLAKSGNIKDVCLPNALLTLAEYARDYGNEVFANKSAIVIDKQINNIENPVIRERTIALLEKIRTGKGDFFV